MKKYIVSLTMLSVLAACGGNTSNKTNNDTAAANTTASSGAATGGTADLSSNPDYQKGLDLVSSSDCLTCHKVDEKLVGPAYQDVANKYAGVDTAVTYLAHRIIHGVNPAAGDKSDWGDVTNNAVMTPHPQVSEADAEQMVKYVLLLKTK